MRDVNNSLAPSQRKERIQFPSVNTIMQRRFDEWTNKRIMDALEDEPYYDSDENDDNEPDEDDDCAGQPEDLAM